MRSPASLVRVSMASLTMRGRCFMAAGLTSTLGAILFDYRILLRAGLLLAALPLVGVFSVGRARFRVTCRRTLEPVRVAVGEEARVFLRLENTSRIPSGALLAEDRVPYVLGARPRFVLDQLEPGGVRQVVYRARSDIRGRFVLGPLSLRLTDPFGMCELSRSYSARDVLTVTPAVYPLPDVRMTRGWSARGEGHATSIVAAGEDDVGTREYRHGDELRRVHWKSTARVGELMVRREEQVWQSRATLLLDLRGWAHRGSGPGSSAEWAVSAVASIAVHLASHGYAIRMTTENGPLLDTAAHDATAGLGGTMMNTANDTEGLLLDALAVVAPSRVHGLRAVQEALRHGGGDGLLVAVLGDLTDEDATALATSRQATTTAVAFLLDVDTWLGGHRSHGQFATDRISGNAALLRAAGWRVVPVAAGASLPDLWRLAALRHSEAAS